MMDNERFLDLISEFLSHQVDVESFRKRFTRLWVQHRDAEYAKARTWPEPYDKQLQDAVLRGKITKAEFSEKWEALWGYSERLPFLDMIDAIHSACHVFNPDPKLEWEIDEAQLRLEVTTLLESYLSKDATQ